MAEGGQAVGSTDLELLLTWAREKRPALETPLPFAAAAGAPLGARPEGPPNLWNDGKDPNDLAAQRWGLVAPEGPAGDRLLALVEPLRRIREQAQGAKAEVFRVPASLDGTDASRWKKENLYSEALADEDRPRYLLLLGDLHEVPLELQQTLSTDAFVGRLAFDGDGGYEAYAAKAVRAEAESSRPAPRPRALFFTAHDGSGATRRGYESLVQPLIGYARDRLEGGTLGAGGAVEVGSPGAVDVDALLAETRKGDPALLVSVSHGLGLKGEDATPALRRATQGAMGLGSLGSLGAAEVAGRPFLPGGIWVFYACFGGGTPARSLFRHWLSTLKDAGGIRGPLDFVLDALPSASEPPFIAALPKAVLGSPDGPLGVISHVDLAWTYGFEEPGRTRQTRASRFYGMIRALLEGARSGVGLSALLRHLGEANSALAIREDDAARRGAGGPPAPPEEGLTRANLWMLRQDLLGYVLLGDPAARFVNPAGAAEAVARGERARSTTTPAAVAPGGLAASAASILGIPGLSGPPPRTRAAVEDAERAVLALLAGSEPGSAIAARLGVAKEEVEAWAAAYHEAGRSALRGLLG